MKDWQALKPVLFMLAAAGVVLLIIAGLLSQGWDQSIVPPPEMAAEELVGALGAHRYEGAMNQLSQDLKKQTKEEDLRNLVNEIEQSPKQGIQDAHGQSSEEQDEQATASVNVKFGNNQEQEIQLPLTKEQGLWKVSSLEPIRALGR